MLKPSKIKAPQMIFTSVTDYHSQEKKMKNIYSRPKHFIDKYPVFEHVDQQNKFDKNSFN